MWAEPPSMRANREKTMVAMKRSWAVFRELLISDKLVTSSPASSSSTAEDPAVMAAPAMAMMKMTKMKN